MKKLLYTKRELSEILGCSVSKIDKLMASGDLPYYKYGKSKQSGVRFTSVHIKEFLSSMRA